MSSTSIPPREQLLQLQRGQLLAWNEAHTKRLRVLAGVVWMTREGDLGDHFLQAGDCVELYPGTHTLLQAERDARLIVESPGTTPRGGRGRRSWWQPDAAPAPRGVALGAP